MLYFLRRVAFRKVSTSGSELRGHNHSRSLTFCQSVLSLSCGCGVCPMRRSRQLISHAPLLKKSDFQLMPTSTGVVPDAGNNATATATRPSSTTLRSTIPPVGRVSGGHLGIVLVASIAVASLLLLAVVVLLVFCRHDDADAAGVSTDSFPAGCRRYLTFVKRL